MKFRLDFQKKWLVFAGIFGFLAMILLVGSKTFLKDIHYIDRNLSVNTEVYLSFSSNYAQPDTPLKVFINGADDDNVEYTWTIGESTLSYSTDSYTPSNADLEKFITVTATYDGSKTVSASLYCSKLPVIYINADEEIGDEYVSATMAMQGNSEYNSSNTTMYFGDIYLKLRGNSTKYRSKSPFKIKLAESCDLFNMGENKHWVLLANDIDHTFIRNKLIYDFSSDIGASFATESLNVVLILNNEYNGVYQLCEQIRIDEERVNIFDWEALAKDAAALIASVKYETEGLTKQARDEFEENLAYGLCTDFSWITAPYTFEFNGVKYNLTDYVDIPDTTGGFILEMDFYNNDNPNGVQTNFQQPFYFNSPEFAYTNDDLKLYAKNYIQSFEYALHSEDFFYRDSESHSKGVGYYYDPVEGWIGGEQSTFYMDPSNNGKHYSELFDMNSLLVNFFVCEFSMNWDSMKNSTFITKDLNGLAELSPVWDFDWAFGNENMYNIDTYFPTGWHTTNDYFTNEQYYQSQQWNRYLIKDPYFLYLAYQKYHEIRPTVIEDIIKEGGLLDQYYDKYKEAGAANDAKWGKTYTAYGGKNYENAMASLTEFIETRIAWMDEQFSSFDSFVESLGYYVSSDEINVTDVTYNGDGTYTITGKSSLSGTYNLVFQINGTTLVTAYAGTDGVGKSIVDASVFGELGTNIIQIHATRKNGDYISGSNYYIY